MTDIFSPDFPTRFPKLRIGLHVLFWAMMFQFFVYLKAPILGLSYWSAALVATKDLVVISSLFYAISYYIVPNLILKRRPVLVLVSILLIYYYYATSVYIEFKLIPQVLDIPGRGYQNYMSRVLAEGYIGILKFKNSAEIFLDLSYLLSPALIIKLFTELVKISTRALKLERDNLNLELAFLKSQLNPHFLFNTLNNVYSLTLYKSDLASEAVLKLSNLMRYTLYESNTGQISLEKEVTFFQDYIELERMRHSSKVTITFEMEGDPSNLIIAPLIIFPFIENAFKHGTDSRTRKSYVTIHLEVADATLKVKIENSRHQGQSTTKKVGGIGVKNAEKRLNLLYPDRHLLQITETDTTFSVYLEMKLR